MLGLGRYARAERAAIDKACGWLEATGLIERADDPAGDLPYGAQRRLEIARAMCTDPVLLCLDEPAAGLNPHEKAELNELILALRDRHATSVLLIEHDMSVVMEISDHIIVLDYGTKIADGAPDAVRNDHKVIAAYLGVAEQEVERVQAEVDCEARQALPDLVAPRGVAAVHAALIAVAATTTARIAAAAKTYPAHTVTIVVPLRSGRHHRFAGTAPRRQAGAAFRQTGRGREQAWRRCPHSGGRGGAGDPDGHTLMVSPSSAMAANVTLYKKLPLRSGRGFRAARAAGAYAVRALRQSDVGINSVADLIRRRRTSRARLRSRRADRARRTIFSRSCSRA